MPLKLAFMGSPEIAVSVLEKVIEAGHDVVCVYTQPPRKAGRGKSLRPTPVHAYADEQGIEVRHPKSLRKPNQQEQFAALDIDAAVVVAYGLILPQPILDAPRHGCINLHASNLPRWRGAAPIQRAIMAGDTHTAVETMQMDAGLDTGPILGSHELGISSEETAGSLHDRMAIAGASLMVETLSQLEAGTLQEALQSDDGATYADKLTSQDARIDWARPARLVDCHIRGLSPFPGAWFECEVEGQPVRIKALFSAEEDTIVPAGTPPGMVLDNALLIACETGAVRLKKLQRPGKAPTNASDFLRGFPISKGDAFK